MKNFTGGFSNTYRELTRQEKNNRLRLTSVLKREHISDHTELSLTTNGIIDSKGYSLCIIQEVILVKDYF